MNLREASEVLRVNVFSTVEEIRKAYHDQSRKVHPDVRPNDPQANARMATLNAAYRVLRRYAESNEAREPVGASVATDRPADYRAEPAPPADDIEHLHRLNVVWAGPPRTPSRFFARHGFVLRPTHDRVAFRVVAKGVHQFTLERHIEHPAVLICRDRAGAVVTFHGAALFIDDGYTIEPFKGDD